MSDWFEVEYAEPPYVEVVETRIRDSRGERNIQTLKKMGNLWFVPDGSSYVYYKPTHWRHLSR